MLTMSASASIKSALQTHCGNWVKKDKQRLISGEDSMGYL